MTIRRHEGWISVHEAAKILGVSPQGVHHMIQSGKINAESVGDAHKKYYILLEEEVFELALDRIDKAAERAEMQERIDRSRQRRRAAGRPMLEYMESSVEDWNIKGSQCDPATGYHSTPHRGCILR